VDAVIKLFGKFWHKGKLLSELPADLPEFITWKFDQCFDGRPAVFANIISGGKKADLTNDSSDHIKHMHAIMKSIKSSFACAQNDFLSDFCPEFLVRQFCEEFSEQLLQISKLPRPDNYDFLVRISRLVHEISKRKLKLKLQGPQKERVEYTIFGTRTGRLGTTKHSFPIMNIAKKKRNNVLPNNDCFVEIDFNAMDARTFLRLAGKPQPQCDFYEWSAKQLNLADRKEAKITFLRWLNGGVVSDQVDHDLGVMYNKLNVIKKFVDGNLITNSFGRQIESDPAHFISHLVQSESSDFFLNKAIEVNEFLRDKKSKIAFLIHDSAVIDFCKEEKAILEPIRTIMQGSEQFVASFSIGKNFGEMKRIG